LGVNLEIRPGLVIDYGLEMGGLSSAFHASFSGTGVETLDVPSALAETFQFLDGVLLSQFIEGAAAHLGRCALRAPCEELSSDLFHGVV
jgi:hypothetical protein